MIVHTCLNVRGAFKMSAKLLGHMIQDENGDYLSADATRDWLVDQLAQGREVLPIGEPCEGFDYTTGCPGHRERAE